MDWDVFQLFSLIGTIAFAASGAIVAMEEHYDILGVIVLGLVTAFGGGVVRNLLIGAPVATLWNESLYLNTAVGSVIVMFVLPAAWIRHWKRAEAFFDAIGLAAFAIQGALSAVEAHLPLNAVMVAAMLTGIGGGMIRDVLAGRKPVVLRDEIYAVWALAAGLAVGVGNFDGTWNLLILFLFVVTFRMLSVYFNWKLPRRSLRRMRRGRKGEGS